MKDLPKELTRGLLGLVLNEELTNKICFFHENEIQISFADRVDKINLDTLTRLMKEWCWSSGNEIMSGKINHSGTYLATVQDLNPLVPKRPFVNTTEFEAVLKATEWVAKEKGLL